MHHKGCFNHKPSECRLGLPTANAAAITGNEGKAESATTLLDLGHAALRMDKYWLESGAIKLTFYIKLCLRGFIVPPSFIC